MSDEREIPLGREEEFFLDHVERFYGEYFNPEHWHRAGLTRLLHSANHATLDLARWWGGCEKDKDRATYAIGIELAAKVGAHMIAFADILREMMEKRGLSEPETERPITGGIGIKRLKLNRLRGPRKAARATPVTPDPRETLFPSETGESET